MSAPETTGDRAKIPHTGTIPAHDTAHQSRSAAYDNSQRSSKDIFSSLTTSSEGLCVIASW